MIYPRLLSGFFSHVGLFHKLKSYEISGQLFGLILFPVTDRFYCFWMGSVCKNIQLMLVFFKALFLVLHFSCYTLMTFLMIIFVIMISVLMILLSTPSEQVSNLRQQ